MSAAFILNRRGTFTLPKRAEHKCKAPAWTSFAYLVRLHTGDRLDERGFVVDHQEVHDTIAKDPPSGSCELVCREIALRLRRLCVGKRVVLTRLDVKVRPHDPKDPSKSSVYAWMEYTVVLP